MGSELINRENRKNAARRRTGGGRAKAGLPWWMWAGLAFYAAYLTRLWSHGAFGVGDLILLILLSALCLLPTMRWLQMGMPHLPLGEAFAFMHLIYYVNPLLNNHEGLADYSTNTRVKALLAVLLYLATFLCVYWRMIGRAQRPLPATYLLRREINVVLVWGLFGLWMVLELLLHYGVTLYWGNGRNIFSALLGGVGSIAVVSLFYRCGKGLAGPFQLILAVTVLIIGVGADFVGGVLCIGAGILGAALLAYSLGRKRPPLIAALVLLLVLGFLQVGKTGYRDALVNDKTGYIETPTSLVDAYSLWFRMSWAVINHSQEETKTQNIFERTSLIQVLALAIDTVPHKLPYLMGGTYAMIPKLLVPRIFWPDKPRGTYPTEVMGVYLGIQTEGGTDVTGISVGSVAEGWLNFGWLGLAGAGAFFGLLFGWPASLTRSLEPHHLGWLLWCFLLVTCIDMEHSLPEKFVMISQSVLVVFILLLAISTKPKLRRNPGSSDIPINAPPDASLK